MEDEATKVEEIVEIFTAEFGEGLKSIFGTYDPAYTIDNAEKLFTLILKNVTGAIGRLEVLKSGR